MTIEKFGETREKRTFKSDTKKPQFLDLNFTATIRILTSTRLALYTHYINRCTVKCLGEDCPICRSNKNIIIQNPETFREEAHYAPRREVKFVNVLDKSMARVCECGVETRSAPGVSTAYTCKCGKIVTGEPAPLNKVKILSKGVTLFDQIDAIENAIRDASGEVIGVTNYDITLAVSGTGKNKIITPIPGQHGPVEVDETELFDLEKVTPELFESEMLDLQRGVSLRDIFAARRATEKAASNEVDFLSKESLDSVNSTVDSLFGTPS